MLKFRGRDARTTDKTAKEVWCLLSSVSPDFSTADFSSDLRRFGSFCVKLSSTQLILEVVDRPFLTVQRGLIKIARRWRLMDTMLTRCARDQQIVALVAAERRGRPSVFQNDRILPFLHALCSTSRAVRPKSRWCSTCCVIRINVCRV